MKVQIATMPDCKEWYSHLNGKVLEVEPHDVFYYRITNALCNGIHSMVEFPFTREGDVIELKEDVSPVNQAIV